MKTLCLKNDKRKCGQNNRECGLRENGAGENAKNKKVAKRKPDQATRRNVNEYKKTRDQTWRYKIIKKCQKLTMSRRNKKLKRKLKEYIFVIIREQGIPKKISVKAVINDETAKNSKSGRRKRIKRKWKLNMNYVKEIYYGRGVFKLNILMNREILRLTNEIRINKNLTSCLLYTSDAADE